MPTRPAWSPDGAYVVFVLASPPPLRAATVYVLPEGSTDAFPIAVGTSFAWQPLPLASPIPSAANLGLDFPICRVMSMPIAVAGAPGNAYVFTRADVACPKAGEGTRFVAADLNGDGLVDTPPVRLDGCFPPVGCETFAAPDVNGDGTSEIAVSNAGADGYGVWLFAVTTSPPAVVPVDVADPQGIGYIQTGPLEFAWVDVAGHAEGAMCETSADGTNLSIFGYDKFEKETEIRATTLHLDSTTATVTDASKDRIPLADAVVPGNDLCGASLHGSAANFPDAVQAAGTDIGLDAPLCDVSDTTADVTGDQQLDMIWVGVAVRPDGRCPDAYDAESVVAVDVTGDGLADTSSTAIAYCVSCAPFGTIDFDADGTNELIVTEQAGSEIQYGVFAVRPTGVSGSFQVAPVLVADPGDPKGGFDGGKPFTFWAGGDEGRDEFVRCDSYPDAPVMVSTQTSHPVEGPGSETKTVHITRLQLEADGLFHVSGVDEYTQSTSDPTTFPKPATACGLRLDLYL
jgi:hypothetical protein